jgi:thioesterase domain-containing protein
LLFAATEGETTPPTKTWRPYVDGQIKVHWIECTHQRMMLDPLSIIKIGDVLATELGKQANGSC